MDTVKLSTGRRSDWAKGQDLNLETRFLQKRQELNLTGMKGVKEEKN